jgi:hypothetical protein
VRRAATYSRIGPGSGRWHGVSAANELPGRLSATLGPGLSLTPHWGRPQGRAYPLRVMTRNRPTPPEQSPVFVDGSGRRLRRLRVAGAIVVVPAVGYVGLLFSTLLGGPTIHSPFLPLPDQPPAATVLARPPQPVPATSSTSGPNQPVVVGVVATRQPGARASTTVAPLLVAVASPTSVPSPTTIPSPTSTVNGKSALAPTPTKAATGKPTALPTPTRRPIKP